MITTKHTHTLPPKLRKLFLEEWVSAVISAIELLHLGTQISLVFGRLLKRHRSVASFIFLMTSLQKQGWSTLQNYWEIIQLIRQVMQQKPQIPQILPWQTLKRESFSK